LAIAAVEERGLPSRVERLVGRSRGLLLDLGQFMGDWSRLLPAQLPRGEDRWSRGRLAIFVSARVALYETI
jgi:hypothetical protein